jgi:hypothetical protein
MPGRVNSLNTPFRIPLTPHPRRTNAPRKGREELRAQPTTAYT